MLLLAIQNALPCASFIWEAKLSLSIKPLQGLIDVLAPPMCYNDKGIIPKFMNYYYYF